MSTRDLRILNDNAWTNFQDDAMHNAIEAVIDVLDSEMAQAEQHLRISRTNNSLGERMLGQHNGASRVIGSIRAAIAENLPKEKP